MSAQPLRLLFRGPVLTSSGYGVHSRQLLDAFIADARFDVFVEQINWGETSYIDPTTETAARLWTLVEKREHARRPDDRFDVGVQVTIPNEFKRVAAFNVGVTAGIEVDHASAAWVERCNTQTDMVVVPSYHSKQVLEASAFRGNDGSVLAMNKPVDVVPEGVDIDVFNTTPSEDVPVGSVVLPPFNFLHVGLMGAQHDVGAERKNVSGLVKIFCERFKGREDVGLILKSSIVNNSLMDHDYLMRRISAIKASTGCGKFPTITVVHGALTDVEMSALYRHPRVGAFVSLTHGEGFGLPLLEAAACGLPVIATAWSGHLDFLTHDGTPLFVPVKFRLSQVPSSVVWDGVIDADSRWADPDPQDAGTQMVRVLTGKVEARALGAAAAAHIRTHYSLQSVGRRFVDLVYDRVISSRTSSPTTPRTRANLIDAMRSRVAGDGQTILFTMPMSAGDVLISTAVVRAIKRKFPKHRIFYATSPKFAEIARWCPDVHAVIDFQQWMIDVPLCEEIFDEVFTPNLGVQMVFSNWVHRGKGRNLLDEMAHQCGVALDNDRRPTILLEEKSFFTGGLKDYVVVHPGSGKDSWEARAYIHWEEVVDNLKHALGDRYSIIQVGADGEDEVPGVVSLVGKTKGYGQLAGLVAGASLVVSIDSVVAHMAMGLGIAHVALYGGSYPSSTGPSCNDTHAKRTLQILLETPDRHGCRRACYQTACVVDRDDPCINEIKPRDVVSACLLHLSNVEKERASRHVVASDLAAVKFVDLRSGFEHVERRPKISGYTHFLNPSIFGFPWRESLQSMLGFCDEVVVVDGGSTDGTRHVLGQLAADDERIVIYDREWDWNEPGMDGMQKAFGRALCTGDILWQQDADEVVHEDDYEKIRRAAKLFPRSTSLVHLPVIELWGPTLARVRTDRHAWKWRMSRNDFRVTHGIVKRARIFDEKNGRTYARRGMSDGCEMIDAVTGEYVPHRGFWNDELERLRRGDPVAYGVAMNDIFDRLPSVWHFSWADFRRKIVNFKEFWGHCWSNLYREDVHEDRFPDVDLKDRTTLEREVRRLDERGGEHGPAPTFALRRRPPDLMLGFIEEGVIDAAG